MRELTELQVTYIRQFACLLFSGLILLCFVASQGNRV